MDRTRLTAFVGVLAIVLQSSFPQPARAEEPSQPRIVTTGRSLQPRLALASRHSDDIVLGTEGTHSIHRAENLARPVPRECKPKYMVGPGMGIPLSLGAIAGGISLVGVGAFQLEIFGPDPRTARDRAAIATGSILIAGGWRPSSILPSSCRRTDTPDDACAVRRRCVGPLHLTWAGEGSGPTKERITIPTKNPASERRELDLQAANWPCSPQPR